MATNETPLMEKLKGVAVRVGTQGVHYVVEGTIAAVKAMDRLQKRIPRQQKRVVRVRREEPALERPRPARPARKPLKVSGAETPPPPKRKAPERKTGRTQGRKTMAPATAPRRVTAPPKGFKAKRGQKLDS